MAATEDFDANSVDLRKLLGQQLHSLAQFGVTELSRPGETSAFDFEPAAEAEVANPPPAKPAAKKETPAAAPKSKGNPAPAKPVAGRAMKPVSKIVINDEPWGPPTEPALRSDALNVVNAEVKDCQNCEELCSNRTQTVFGVGNASARLVFVGEGPGADEDRLGEPFVGAAGKLLNKILAASKLNRDDVYILNTVKCRPPRNRNPTESEITNCWGYAERQLDIIQPEFICCLGSVAAKKMLQTTQALGRLRGKFHPWRGAQLIATYHPAYLLRNESAKRHVWEDMKMLVKEMGIELSN